MNVVIKELRQRIPAIKTKVRRYHRHRQNRLFENNQRQFYTWAASLLRYSAAFAGWSKSEPQAIGRTRKLFTIYGALHPKSDVDRLYIPRKKGVRGLISIQDCVELAIRALEVYVYGSEEGMIQAARRDKIDALEAASVLKRSKKEKRLEDWEQKVLRGQYLMQTKNVTSDQC